jgi:hypothetical protein
MLLETGTVNDNLNMEHMQAFANFCEITPAYIHTVCVHVRLPHRSQG